MTYNTGIIPTPFLVAGMLMTIAMACQPVKEYQKNKLNDSEMSLSNRKVEKTELSFQSYREGAAGANAGKSGGGCGCN
jgi:hypothetical protein